jgi:hypothetical protein
MRPTFCGRAVSDEEWALLHELVDSVGLSRTELAATICETLGWKRVNGRLKTRECYEYLGLLDERGLLAAPAKDSRRPRGATSIQHTEASAERPSRTCDLRQVLPVTLELASTSETRALWRELVDRHHYLGHKVAYGARLRYLVWMESPRREIAGCLQYSSAARRLSVRDRWIGWDDATRAKHLPAVACNSRFLILPWLHVRDLASHVLALGSRVMADDWQDAYGVRPVLLETFVDPERFEGTCYRAANWAELGTTAGRGRMDRTHSEARRQKTCLVSPLVSDFRSRLGVR